MKITRESTDLQIPSARPYFSEGDIEKILDDIRHVLQSGRLILGANTRKFEESFREYCGVKYAVAVSSCTAALEIAFRYYDVTAREVIVPTNTFLATCNAIVYGGGTPVLADIRSDTLCLDPAEVKRKLTAETKGIVVVHLAGLPCPDIDEIRTICREKHLFLVEDVAHAHGAMINGEKTGSLGDAGCFSFYPTKVMSTCVGGMITTDDEDLADFAISLRHHGVGKDLNDIVNLGNDWLMSEIDAVLGIQQLEALEDNLEYRNRIARRYSEQLAGVEGIRLFEVPPHVRHSYYKYAVYLAESLNKNELVAEMKSRYNIDLGSSYDPPCHLQPVYQNIYGYRPGMFPVAEKTLKSVVALPMFVSMTDQEVDFVAASLKEVLPGLLHS